MRTERFIGAPGTKQSSSQCLYTNIFISLKSLTLIFLLTIAFTNKIYVNNGDDSFVDLVSNAILGRLPKVRGFLGPPQFECGDEIGQCKVKITVRDGFVSIERIGEPEFK